MLRLGAVATVDTGAGSCRDRQRGVGGSSRPSTLGLGAVTTVNVRAGHGCHGHQRWSFQEKNKERNPDLPTRSTKSCTDEADVFKSCPSTLNVRIHVRGGGDSSRGPGKVSASPDLPVRSAVSRLGEPERPRGQTDASDTHARIQSVAKDSRRPANTSKCIRRPQNDLEPYSPGNRAQRSHKGL